MENYYERLEVSKNASPEIIEKAYRVLAKKYHPDMQEEEKKAWAEEEFKKINEAYEILSDEEKKKEYDASLKDEEDEKYQELTQEIEILKQELRKYIEKEQVENSYKNVQTNYSNVNEGNGQVNQNSYNKYNSNNERQNQNINTNNYQYKQPNTYNLTKEDWLKARLKGFLSIILTIIIIISIAYILWIIPFTHRWLQNLYQENEGIKTIVDIFIK